MQTMDELDRIYEQLAASIRARFPQFMTQPFEIGEIYQHIIPYQVTRREGLTETNSEYESVLMRLIAGERGYLIAEDDVRAALQRELSSPNPDDSAFRVFANRTVSLARVTSEPRAATFVADVAAQPVAAVASSGAAAGHRAPTPPRAEVRAELVRADASAATQTAPLPAVPPRASNTVSLPAPARPASPRAASPRPVAAATAPPLRPASMPLPPARSLTATETGGSCRYCSGSLPTGRRITFCPHCGQDLTVQQCAACGTELDIGWKFCTTCGRSMAVV
jgi:hypothetical protein